MSQNKHGCGIHFHQKNQTILGFRRSGRHLISPNPGKQNKSTHANILHHRWKYKETKTITSLRTGVSYTSHYSARNMSDIFKTGHRHMYSRQLANFQLARSSNPRTAKRQKTRFERSCRRVFNNRVIRPGTEYTDLQKLNTARKYGFLFTESQKIYKRIGHLLYKKARTAPLIEDYPFNIPHGFMAPLPQPEVDIDNLSESVVDMAMIIEPTKDDLNMSQEDRAIAIGAKVYEKHVDLRRLLEDNERVRLKKEQDAIIQARDEAQ
ncbi:unnamed protein product [Rhizophagus irregularis]|nr:unnamed protein product [Rhizophagus irregularis]